VRWDGYEVLKQRRFDGKKRSLQGWKNCLQALVVLQDQLLSFNCRDTTSLQVINLLLMSLFRIRVEGELWIHQK